MENKNIYVTMPTLAPLEEVNEHLLERLNTLIASADADQLLAITEVVAKLNASRRNSDQFTRPETDEAKAERAAVEALTVAMKG